MSIFTRTRDIVAANFADLLDKAEDPSKMIRMIILEMEETLVEVRASAARTMNGWPGSCATSNVASPVSSSTRRDEPS